MNTLNHLDRLVWAFDDKRLTRKIEIITADMEPSK
jgi:hypothetical protein